MVAYNTIQRRNMGELYNAVEWATELSCLSHREIAGSSFADLQVAESFADLQVAERCARLTEPIVKVYVYIYIYIHTHPHTHTDVYKICAISRSCVASFWNSPLRFLSFRVSSSSVSFGIKPVRSLTTLQVEGVGL